MYTYWWHCYFSDFFYRSTFSFFLWNLSLSVCVWVGGLNVDIEEFIIKFVHSHIVSRWWESAKFPSRERGWVVPLKSKWLRKKNNAPIKYHKTASTTYFYWIPFYTIIIYFAHCFPRWWMREMRFLFFHPKRTIEVRLIVCIVSRKNCETF